MRIIAFITDGPTVRDILVHLGEPTAPPRIAPARGPPLWDHPHLGLPRYTRGLMAKYMKLVSTASKGAITDG